MPGQSAGKALAKAAAGPAPKRQVIGIKVRFELNARNGLRRVIFGLEKQTEGEQIHWEIEFQLFEREKKTDAYGDPLVGLLVEVDTALNSRAEKAAQAGLTPGQAAHALGPAADDAKAAVAGEIEKDEAKATVQSTLKKT